ncbi:KPN_02809 family neutral zinc metallopeptidase [Candidatus Thiothrix anitrata]|jgi:hypothetical protein|uniref:Zinc metallopeptidase n=1 Tax=Candidatus Thiothrix anitrata TaxID=2823902 RepID=A0ABX7X1A0_9GAMM|nr:neutral zinc metallopeptidase [Candidatus Thiothrix anitrata]QTR49721.1 zinc metallopeptidase [Candidatus Thiothrix anitrata]
MRWRSGRQSNNVEDYRGAGSGRGRRGGLRIGLLGTVAIVLIGWYMGANPLQLLGLVGGANTILGGIGSTETTQASPQGGALNDDGGKFVSVVLGATEDVWNPLFQQMGKRYLEPKLALFEGEIDSACGFSTAASGPFYCPGDNKIYIDLSFFRELKALGASGEFAQAYVLGHEVGHHVQNLLGITTEVSRLQARMSPRDSNALSVALELQADCYAGVWAHYANQTTIQLDSNDIEDAVNAAASIGDDRLQGMSGKRVNPDSFTHGSARQRMEWFRLGVQSGDMSQCNTFKNS